MSENITANKKKKKRKRMSRGKRQFRRFLVIYAGVLAVASVIICIIVWNKLKNYQKDYDVAKDESNPDIYVEEFVKGLSFDVILKYVEQFGINTREGVNPEENHAFYFAELVTENGASYNRSEKFANALPVYDIYAGTERIAVISLKSEGKNDSFGFHKWQLKNMAFDTENIKYTQIQIKVPDNSTVLYNGTLLDESYIKSQGREDDAVLSQALALGGSASESIKYIVDYTFGQRNITVRDTQGATLSCVIDNNNYDFTGGVAIPAELEQRVFETIDSYIMTMNKKKSFDETSQYIEYGSGAYGLITDVLNSVVWGWTPETVDILEQKVSDYTVYSDTLFGCNYYGRIYKFAEGAMESGEETFNYRLLFRKLDGKWFLNYFVILN